MEFSCKKLVNTFLSRSEVLEGILMLKLIFQIMQQKMQHSLMLWVLHCTKKKSS